jgi:hypothetical protein
MIVSWAYDDAPPVTPSDTTAQFQSPAAGFMVGSAGTVRVVTARGKVRDLTFGLAGQGINLAFTWIKASGTTCTGIVAFVDAQNKGDT